MDKMITPRHFIDLAQLPTAQVSAILADSKGMKAARDAVSAKPLAGKTLIMIFEKPSTRTRVSFEVAIKQLGGESVVLRPDEMQLKRGETLADTARVLSRYADAIMIRTHSHARLEELAAHASVPVINGLSDYSHPCQVMADLMTYEEHRGAIDGRIVAWAGDANNVCTSWIQMAAHYRFQMRVAAPSDLAPAPALIDWARGAGADLLITEDAAEAVTGADLVMTDTWVSMGQEANGGGDRHNILTPYRVDGALMRRARPDALFMHCLPAHRGEEVTDEVMDGPQSVVWDEAENRLHVQKGILSWCLAQ